MAEKTESGRKKVVRELSRLAFMEPEEGCRIKISEKMKALELLGKCLDIVTIQIIKNIKSILLTSHNFLINNWFILGHGRFIFEV